MVLARATPPSATARLGWQDIDEAALDYGSAPHRNDRQVHVATTGEIR